KEFAEFDAVRFRLDRLEFSAEFRRRIRLEIEGVEVRRAAAEVDEDRRFRPRLGIDFARGGELQVIRQRQPGGAEHACLDEIAAIQAVAVSMHGHQNGPLPWLVWGINDW